jgi:S-disulfanyl-L-cysteine oxidoreductase SoxD
MRALAKAVTHAGLALLAVGAAVGLAEGADGKPADSKIWNGVYTAAQAERGKDNFEKSCSNCHNSDLNGSVRAPSLRGDRFLRNWENGSANVLFVKLRDSMPATYPDTVSDETKIDILAFLLQENGFPAGNNELKLDQRELDDIQIVQKDAQTTPNFAFVRMVGCLTQGSKGWQLTRSSEPAVSKDEKPTPAALKDAAGQLLGTETFGLLSITPLNPESHKDRKVEARGLLYRDSGRNLVNLTSLDTVGEKCPE